MYRIAESAPASQYDEDPPSFTEDDRWTDEEQILSSEWENPVYAKPSQFVEHAIFIPSAGELSKFSFDERRYLKTIYNTKTKRILLMAGRQVEKSQCLQGVTSLANGYLKKAGEVEVGDKLATMLNDGASTGVGEVSWVSKRYRKPCVKIVTRQGHEADVALTHPMRKWEEWVEAGKLEVGDRLAVVRRCGEFGIRYCSAARLGALALLLGDGSLGRDVSFTGSGPRLESFLRWVNEIGDQAKTYSKAGSASKFVRVSGPTLKGWLSEDDLLGCLSEDKFVPKWVFDLVRRDTAFFLNTLWSTDGHIKKVSESKYDIVYSSISKRLVRDVQALLWKFGIPTGLRVGKPKVYEGTEKEHYMLRVETHDGICRFLEFISRTNRDGEIVPPPDRRPNNNRDTYPIEINRILVAIQESGDDSWEGRRNSSLYAVGLRRTLKYPPTKDKLWEYVNFFRKGDYDQSLVDDLEAHAGTDLYWDEIVEIKDLGEQECVDFEVEGTHNFVLGGMVTHNSTLLGNKILSHMALIPFLRCLYVSPSHTQTKTFSRDRIKEPIEVSPILSKYTNTKLLMNVLEKKFINRSQITMRFAFLNADRVRGIPADLINVDEFQDILLDNVPVIEECASHSSYKLFTYSGTPKSLDNALEHYWSRYSTQNEWTVPCKHHGTPKDPSSWHWNVLDEPNIGKKGLICDKCGEPISPLDPDCSWVSMNPHPKVEKPYEGYRIPQLMVPWIDHGEILDKQIKYSRAKFHNEVLGRSFDSGTRPLTRSDVKGNCWEKLSMSNYQDVKKYCSQHPVFMGVDWGGGSEDSFTVVTLGGYFPFAPDYYTIFYARRFEGMESEPKVQLQEIRNLIREFSVRFVGADYGGGFWPNDELTRDFGPDKIKKYQWVGNVKKKIKFEPQMGVPRFLCHRTEVMSDIFNAIKRQNVFRFPRWEEFENPFAADCLNIFSEYNERLRMNVYKRGPGYPDDTFHSITFGFLASFFYKNRPDVVLPVKEIDRDYSDEDVNDVQ